MILSSGVCLLTLSPARGLQSLCEKYDLILNGVFINNVYESNMNFIPGSE